jgi:hypothetical protein
MLNTPSEDQYKKIGDKILYDLMDRGGIKHGFNDIDKDIMDEIRLTIGKIAFEESITCLTLNGY